jgi:hypothetical protein
VGAGFRGRSGPPTVAEPPTDGHGPAHGRPRTSARTGAEKATDGAGGSGYTDRSHPDSPSDLPFRVLFFQAAQPRGQRAAPDPHPAARQPHRRRPSSLPAPAVESRPGHPQLGDHLIDRQQRVIRRTGCTVRGGGGPAGSGWRSRGRPVRGSATTDAPLRPPRQVRPPPRRPRRTAPRGCRETGKEEGPRRRGRAAWRAPRSCRRGSPAGPGAGSRTVADGTLPPAAGQRGGLASRPGPQASTRTSPRQVKSAPPQAGTGLTPGPEPRIDTARCPPRTSKGTGQPWARHREGGTVARARATHATVALALRAARQPDEGVPACRQHAALPEGSFMGWLAPRTAALSATTEIGFSGPFSRAAGKSAWARSDQRARQTGARAATAGPGTRVPGYPGMTGLPVPGTVAPARGLCAPGTAHGRVPWAWPGTL